MASELETSLAISVFSCECGAMLMMSLVTFLSFLISPHVGLFGRM